MLVHQFPDLNWLKRQANTSFADRRAINGVTLPVTGWPNVIMHTTTKNVVRDEIRGPLSIFTNRSGSSRVTVENKQRTITPDIFFISNTGQYYTLEVNDKTATETANIHFGEKFSQEALRTISLPPGALLENAAGVVPSFHNRVVPASAEFKKIMNLLLVPEKDQLQEDQGLFQLLVLLSQDQTEVGKMQARISALKSSTKAEIMKRLLHVTDYLHTSYNQSPALDDLARISCLSKFHFLRLFKIAYGQTPHQFITTLKIGHAKELLKKPSTNVKEIASTLGFRDASTFSRLFRNQTGVYPSQFRAEA